MFSKTIYSRFIFLLSFILNLVACGMQRQPIPPGTIPSQGDLPRSEEAYGQQVLNQLSKQYSIVHSEKLNRRVHNIVTRLADSSGASRNPWRIFILNGDDVLNAAATRGNYVFVWTGLLRIVNNDDELATVLGHEIGHVLAGHTMPTPAEEVNQILVGAAGSAANAALGSGVGILGGQLASSLAQALIINPESQRIELEADHIGLFMMARAGYDPRYAVKLWKKLSSQIDSSGPALAFLSTHPPSQERIDQFNRLMPRALAEFNKNPSKDSFDYNPTTKTDTFDFNPNSLNKRPKPYGETWIVQEDWTEVYGQADQHSRLITRLFYGDHVRVRSSNGHWLEIDRPVRGYVQGRDFSPIETKK